MGVELVNIGNPHEFSILRSAQKVKTITNSNSKITFDPRPPNYPEKRCPDPDHNTRGSPEKDNEMVCRA
jgi:hypothetical protein